MVNHDLLIFVDHMILVLRVASWETQNRVLLET